MSLTTDQLAAIRQYAELVLNERMITNVDVPHTLARDVGRLLSEIKRLQAALIAKDAVLAQFSDDMNWYAGTREGRYKWANESNPIELAERAMLEGHD